MRTFKFYLMILAVFMTVNLASKAESIVDVVANSPNHTILEIALNESNLTDDLEGSGSFTLFAPTDAAFNALPEGTLEALLADSRGLLTDILLYHLVKGEVMSTDLSNGQVVDTYNGDDKKIRITINTDGVFINDAKVTVADIQADNGVVHVIDAVLIPSTKPATVVDIVVNSEDHTTLEAAVVAAGLVETLQGTGPFTVFAPTDAAFAALPAGTVESLLEDPSGALTDILLYHVVGAKAMSSDLSDGQMITTVFGKDVMVKITADGVYINDAKVTVADIEADNGVVHVIDAVLIPSNLPATVVDIIVESDEHITLEAAVVAAGLVETLQGEGPFTVFAPTDAAFAALPIGTVNDLLADPTGDLTDILLYHVVAGKALSSDLSDGQMIETVLGKDIRVMITSDGVYVNNAMVSVVDLEADNGVVHVIDAVLIPQPDIMVKETAEMGKIITDAFGNSLYFFTRDANGMSMCVGGCLNNWPVFYAENMEIGEGLNADDFGSIDRGEGVMQTTYKGWPLYYFVKDTEPGLMLGDGVIGKWFIAKPDYTIMITDNQLTGLNGVNYKADYSVGDEVIQYFTDDNGLTLYTWKNDLYNMNQFTKPDFSNNSSWPIYEETDIIVPSVLNSADFEVIDVHGKKQLTFKGWPLYYFGRDMMTRGNNKGVSVPAPGVWPVAVNSMMKAYENATVVDIIVKSETHTTLEAAVVAAGLVETLQGTGPFTVFAPTDAAFAALPEGTVEALLSDIPALTNILTYHVVGAKAMSSDLSNGQMILTVQGKEVTVAINEDGVFINNAKVTLADLEAKNGVVHVIDAVLMPPTIPATVVDIIVNSEDHTTLEAAVVAAGLAETLQGEGPFTVFAPTDAAFAALPEGTVEALLGDIPALTNILTYHVAGAKAMSSDLSDGQMIVTVQGKEVTVTINEDGVFINNAKVTVADLEADNGVVHVIDAVLIPSAMPATVVDIIVNSEDHTTLEAAVVAAGLVETLQVDGPFTVFAPTDAAFAALPEGTVEALLGDIPALTNILTYHVVGAKAMSSDLSDGQMIVTVQGKEVTVTINEDGVFINNAKVTVADLEAENGVVHVIDAVLLPPVDKAAFPIDFETKTDATWNVFANGAGANEDFMVISNPDKSGLNMSDNVLKFKVNEGADPWAGAFSDSYAPVEFTEESHMVTIMVWKSVISPVAFKVEGSTNGGPITEVKVSNTVINQWEKITFDFSSLVGYSYNRIVIFPDFPDKRTSGTTVYLDNIEIEKGMAMPATVVDIIVNSEDHVTLEAAVIAAGLVETLQGEGPFTVFAPTDAAFAALPIGTVNSLLEDPNGALTDILLYHVVAAKAMSSDLSDGQMITTVFGKDVKVKITANGVYINDAMVTVADIEAQNGVVHVIDAVLIPSSMPATVVDIIVNSNDHNTLEAAVVAAGLVETLQGDGPFTVFAPTDAAFAALPEGTVEALLGDIPALTNILTYHVAGAKAMSSDLSDGQMIVTVQGKEVTVTINENGVFINNAKVTVADLEAENGVVHVIDAVLIPSTTGVSVFDEITFDVYPNPATDYIRINSNVGVESLIIRDIAGRAVTQKNNVSTSERIELNGFKSGIYLVTMKNGDSVSTKKLIVR